MIDHLSLDFAAGRYALNSRPRPAPPAGFTGTIRAGGGGMLVQNAATTGGAADVPAMAYTLGAAGWLVAEFAVAATVPAGNPRVIAMGDVFSSPVAPLFINGTTRQIGSFFNSFSVYAATPVAAGRQVVRAAVTWDAGGRAICVDGGAVTTDANAFGTGGTLWIGHGTNAGGTQAWINDAVMLVEAGTGRISDAALQALTA